MRHLGKLIILSAAGLLLAGCSLDGMGFGSSSGNPFSFSSSGGGLFPTSSSGGGRSQSSSSSSSSYSPSSSKTSKEKQVYSQNFYNYDGTFLWSTSAYYGDKVVYAGPEPTRPSETGIDFFFSGWSNSYALDYVTSDNYFYAQYDEQRWQVHATFLDEEGNVLYETDCDYGTNPYYVGEDPEKASTSEEYRYVFQGWEPNMWEAIYEDTVYKPTFYEERTPDPTPYTQGLGFGYREDLGGYFVDGYWGEASDIVIPARYDWKPVIGIDNWAFSGRDLQSVTLPDSLQYINDYAFANNPSLSFDSLPESLIYIGDGAFENTAMKTTTEGNYLYVGTAENPHLILRGIERGNPITELSIDGDCRFIGPNACSDLNALTEIRLPMGIVSIGRSAFSYCGNVQRIVFPATLRSIGESAFYCCGSVESLIGLPEGLESIGCYAFFACGKLSSVELPSTVRSIQYDAFSATAITSFEFPRSFSYINGNPFHDCPNLVEITVAEGNEFFAAKDNFLLSKDEKKVYLGVGNLGEEGKLVFPEGITAIAPSAFISRQDVKSIVFPESLETIEDNAFNCCYSLAELSLPKSLSFLGNGAFNNCTMLTEITVPGTVEFVNGYAFANCTNLVKAVIEEGVRTLSYQAFGQCGKLVDVTLPSTLEYIESRCFAECVSLESIYLPRGLYGLYDNPFAGCTSLKSIAVDAANPNFVSLDGVLFSADRTRIILAPKQADLSSFVIPDSVTEISDGAFYQNETLTSIVVPSSVKEIYHEAFAYCKNLVKADLSNATNLIYGNSQVFCGCEALSELLLPDAMISIGTAFAENCVNLEQIDFPSSLVSIEWNAFQSSGLAAIELPSSLKALGGNVFANCKNLASVAWPDMIESYQDGIFQGCTSLASIALPAGMVEVPRYTFYSCTSLQEIQIRGSLKHIGESAFANCDSLTDLNFLSGQTCTLDNYTLAECDGFTSLTLPNNIVDIPYGCFQTCANLELVRLGSAVNSIGDYAFSWPQSGKFDIILPSSLKSLGESPFINAAHIFYEGSQEDFDAIEKKGAVCDEYQLYFYSESEPSESGRYWHYVDEAIPTVWEENA